MIRLDFKGKLLRTYLQMLFFSPLCPSKLSNSQLWANTSSQSLKNGDIFVILFREAKFSFSYLSADNSVKWKVLLYVWLYPKLFWLSREENKLFMSLTKLIFPITLLNCQLRKTRVRNYALHAICCLKEIIKWHKIILSIFYQNYRYQISNIHNHNFWFIFS